jgi:hypothetical protein
MEKFLQLAFRKFIGSKCKIIRREEHSACAEEIEKDFVGNFEEKETS